jgi:anti-sigma regulatory factor (Ser/Thr protein kinase)
MKMHLSNSDFLGNIDTFIKRYEPSNPDELELTFNKNWISVHPFVLSMVAAAGQRVDPRKVFFDKIVATSGHYLERMGLFKFLKKESGITIKEHESAGRFIPLRKIKNSNELTSFLSEMVPLLHLEPKQADSIKYIVSELVRNVFEHSGSGDGAILSAQYFKKSKKISIGIADAGIGIRTSLAQSYATKDHLEAIHLALTPGITGTTKKDGGTEQNAGAGLFFIKSIANASRDFFVMYSGNAMYKLLKRPPGEMTINANPTKDRNSSRNDMPHWNGTVVGIDLTLDNTAEFSVLLDFIRDTYFEAVKERKKLRYRKPKFI